VKHAGLRLDRVLGGGRWGLALAQRERRVAVGGEDEGISRPRGCASDHALDELEDAAWVAPREKGVCSRHTQHRERSHRQSDER
jgi:hypothetical protein